ncbi:ATP-dependent helicase [Streptomyces phaeolivaceus]|uniref:ATP-dependent helicase n=1 Tax=Streptomyces phaeolivaceus TaxID=2653200 RepID=A0A5P8K9Z6_9ACTN|nr:UvrD-helicase domain-containing protein [Streptomyces phaeolivaceus]QFQ99359.1 ATP-dependent helicase [Streptomyces phaeolivaceus]
MPLHHPRQTRSRVTAVVQEAALAAFRSGQNLVLQAGAGTGKTTTLVMLARSNRRRGRYMAYNTSIAMDARGKFPANVNCRTAHSLAFAAVGSRYVERLNAPRWPSWKTGEALGIAVNMSVRIGDRKVTNKALSYTVLRTVKRFCYSVDTDFRPYHVPVLRGLEDQHFHFQLANIVLPYARQAWEDLQNPDKGVVRFEHDHYLKMWALAKPKIHADYLLLDEAQDTNPVIEEVFTNQRMHAQLVMVGDSAQAIYGWRGARDVMTDFDGDQLSLSQSFRFGPALAEEANRWLAIVEAPIRLQGTPDIDTLIGPVENPDAILCRTNVGAMMEILDLLDNNRRVALVGGGDALAALANAAADLKAGRRTTHPELVLFQTWGELQEYATYDPSGQDLLPLVDVIDEHGVEVILDAVHRLSPEAQAEIIVSTAHKAKGREWPSVRIAPDFEPAPSNEFDEEGNPLPKELNLEEARLAYVAVTRARRQLDPGGLGWINDHPDGGLGNGPAPNAPSSPWEKLGPVPPAGAARSPL